MVTLTNLIVLPVPHVKRRFLQGLNGLLGQCVLYKRSQCHKTFQVFRCQDVKSEEEADIPLGNWGRLV